MSQLSPTTAKKLITAGCHSVEELRLPHFLSILSEKQQAKVRYMGHLEQPVEGEDAEDALVSYAYLCEFSSDSSF
jgi:DNA polymerase beta